MSFNIEMAPRNDATTGATVYAVVVTIDDHETVLSFESREAAGSFAETDAQDSRMTNKRPEAPR
jgi:hypothetical protein